MPITTGSKDRALETRYEHLATKADLHALETRLVKWMVGIMLMFGGMVAAAIASAVAALLD